MGNFNLSEQGSYSDGSYAFDIGYNENDVDTDEVLSTTADTLGSTDSGTLANDQSDSLIGTDSDGSNYGETTATVSAAMVRPTKAAATP